jgi:hypothetical protein
MIFLAYHYYKYRFETKENIDYLSFIKNIININFPNEDYLLPYSNYNVSELVKKLKCESSDIKGTFTIDLPFMMSKCSKLVFFPSDNLYIGSGMRLEIACANNLNLPIFCYNKSINSFTQNFLLKKTDHNLYHDSNNIFNRKVEFI